MIIETKFKRGDSVWIGDINPKNKTVKDTFICCVYKEQYSIDYTLKDVAEFEQTGVCDIYYNENDLFETKEECQKRCNERKKYLKSVQKI